MNNSFFNTSSTTSCYSYSTLVPRFSTQDLWQCLNILPLVWPGVEFVKTSHVIIFHQTTNLISKSWHKVVETSSSFWKDPADTIGYLELFSTGNLTFRRCRWRSSSAVRVSHSTHGKKKHGKINCLLDAPMTLALPWWELGHVYPWRLLLVNPCIVYSNSAPPTHSLQDFPLTASNAWPLHLTLDSSPDLPNQNWLMHIYTCCWRAVDAIISPRTKD